jgi:1,4-alpha-glucan branching enzyme
MRDFLRYVSDLIAVRQREPALRIGGTRVSRSENYDRVVVMHRWVEGTGADVVVVASLDEQPKQGYWIGLPYSGAWREIFNSDYYDGFPNTSVVGNGGAVTAWGGPLDGFSASAPVTLPANGVLVLIRG